MHNIQRTRLLLLPIHRVYYSLMRKIISKTIDWFYFYNNYNRMMHTVVISKLVHTAIAAEFGVFDQ